MPKLLALILSFVLFSFCEARAEDTPAAPETPVATSPAPAPPVNTPASPAPVANKPDEDTEPGAFKRRLQAAAAVITGNHASLEGSSDKDNQIAALQAEVATLKATVAAKEAIIVEAVALVQGLNSGTAKPAAVASNPVAQAAVEVTQQGLANEIRKVGIPAASLTAPASAADPIPASGPIPPSARHAVIREMWKNCGHEIPAPSAYGRN